MIEQIGARRNILAADFAVGTLALGIGAAEASPGPDASAHSLAKKARVLENGDNVSDVAVLSPERTRDTSFDLKPLSRTDTEDLAVVFDQRESDILISALGEPERGDSVGFVIESDLGKTAMKLVFFKTKTGKINLISPVQPLDHPQKLFAYVDPGHPAESYDALVATQTATKKDVTVNFRHRHPAKPHKGLTA